MPLKANIRFRTSAALAKRTERVLKALNEGKENKETSSDLGRAALVLYVEQKEKEFQLPPLDAENREAA